MNIQAYNRVVKELKPFNAQLVAVSKTKPISDILAIYNAGQKIFGENKVQELVDKYEALPKDIEWHMIGHLQRNKVKYIAPFVSLIHGVDSLKLYDEIVKQAKKHERKLNVLLQVFIAEEETKFGLSIDELNEIVEAYFIANSNEITICGLMGMATNTQNVEQIRKEFRGLKSLFDQLRSSRFKSESTFKYLSMGMSGDYQLALKEGSNMIRIGSMIFGERNYV